MDNKKKKILIIEDEPPMLNILRDKLVESGWETLTAQNGEEGLQIALTQHPDLILLDILLPKMNGTLTISKLRQDPWGKTIPVIMLTNVSPDTDKDLQAIVKNQPAYYFVKSDIELTTLTEKIKGIFQET
ncbi:MAG TPA: response regulator [Patescibacteria group bacterium]|nr:response regulator [Patescibacteria group bacterium]